MIAWEVFAKGVGCFALFLAFCFGLFLGVSISWYDSLSLPYIDRRTAILYALEMARKHCAGEDRRPPVDCDHYRLIRIEEDHVGWYMTLLSIDRRRTKSIFIRRRGEYGGSSETDVDDPTRLPSHDLIDRGAAAPSAGMLAIARRRAYP